MGRQVAQPHLPFELRLAEGRAVDPRGILLYSCTTRTGFHHRIARSPIIGTTCFLPEHTGIPGLDRLAYSTHGYHLPSSKISVSHILEPPPAQKNRATQLVIWIGQLDPNARPITRIYQLGVNINAFGRTCQDLNKKLIDKGGKQSLCVRPPLSRPFSRSGAFDEDGSGVAPFCTNLLFLSDIVLPAFVPYGSGELFTITGVSTSLESR